MSYLLVISSILLASYLIAELFFKTEQPKIDGLPEIPGWPIVGNLLRLGSDHATVCKRWAEKYGPVFQVRLFPG
jgi:phenylacetate 2-hydroxylase